MDFPFESLVPKGGDIYCHIFENPRTGLARNLFWSITLEFEPVRYGENEFLCAMTCEWLRWPLRDWRALEGRRWAGAYGEEGIESSFYTVEHHLAKWTEVTIRRRCEDLFTVSMDMLVDFQGYYGGDEDSAMPVRATAEALFMGLLIIPDNLTPKPTSPSEVGAVAAEFVDLRCYEEPEPWGSQGFVRRPALSESEGKSSRVL